MRIVDGLLGHDEDNIYNKRGHRCKELEKLNLKNYILFLGDNISLGLDKPIYKTFPYIVSDKLKMDYYNLSIFNGGYDSLKYNLFSWLAIYKSNLPRMIIITNEFLNSLLECDHSYNNLKVVNYEDEVIKELIEYGNNCGFFSGRNFLLANLITQTINIPIYQVILPDSEVLIKHKNVTDIYVDNKDQDHIAEKVYNSIAEFKRKVMP